MLLHQSQPRGFLFPFKFMAVGQFNPGHGFKDTQNGCLIDLAIADLLIAMRTGLQVQLKRRDSSPKALIVHWLQPCLNVINISEFSHGFKVSRCDSVMQKAVRDGGWI